MMVEFAILAPVPIEHLESGLSVLSSRSYVSYGSRKFELFRKATEMSAGAPVPVLIYPSHEDAVVKVTFTVTWKAEYIGHVEDYAAKASDEHNGNRPASTEKYDGDSASGWPVFWRLRALRRLPTEDRIIIAMLDSYGRTFWRKNSPPRGPEIVARPAGF